MCAGKNIARALLARLSCPVIRGLLAALSVSFLQQMQAAERAQIPPPNARFVGAVGCKSSSCHGGAGEKRSQFIIWTRQDFHARAYAILTNARSARMAETLGLPAAPSSSRCTTCHSPMQALPPARLTSGANPMEGVSCESCHGTAESWLRGHTRKDWSYATRVGAGMRDLKSFYVRANTCVACHQNIDADILASGHPELVFEMNRQTRDEPKHWRDPAGSDIQLWLIGQAVALREASWRLAQNPTPEEHTLGQWRALAAILNKVTDKIEPAASFAEVQQQADALARQAAEKSYGSNLAARLTAPSEPVSFREAQRLLLALESLTSDSPNTSEQLAQLRGDLRSPNEFSPADFTAHLAALRRRLSERD